jgi:hypothetical protein
MKNKKGSAHFEMIVGFVFFIGFVLFLFITLNPWDTSSLPNSAITGLYDIFEQQVKTNLSSVFVKTNYTGTANCFSIKFPKEFFKYKIGNKNSFVTKLGGINIDSNLDSGKLNLKKEDNFFRVAISPEFTDENVASCENLDNFELGGVIEIELFSYSKLSKIKQKYYNDYEGLKKELRLPPVFDFAIIPEGLPEIRMEPVNGIPDGVDVLAKDYVTKVLRSNGAISNERFNIRIW